MDDINEDYKNLKKRLKGKITEKQLDNKLGLEWLQKLVIDLQSQTNVEQKMKNLLKLTFWVKG